MKYLLFLIVVIMILLLMLPMKFRFQYSLIGSKMNFNISSSYLFGIFSPKINPLDEKNKKKKKNSKDLGAFKNILKGLDYTELIDYIWDRLYIKKLHFKSTIGSDSPFIGALLYGLLWNIIGILTGYLSVYKDIEDFDVNILSTFENNCLNVEFDCIIKIKMVYIINIWIRLIKLYRGGVRNVRTSNRRINASYND